VLPGKIIEFIGSLPQRIGDSLSATGPTILEIFRQAFDDANAFITAKFQEILAFIQSVPDRIVALGPVFLQAGKNLITSFMNGFRSVGSFIGDIAGDIVGSVKSFLNKAIDRINSGIAAIDAILPGNLGRIPRLAQGALVGSRPGGTLAVVGEGREDEVVAPLSKLEDIIRKAFGGDDPGGGAMTVNFAAGSISIGFSGSTPSEGEARSVGRAVGDGIADQLAKRNIRTQVRAA
jgi:phage-related protein